MTFSFDCSSGRTGKIAKGTYCLANSSTLRYADSHKYEKEEFPLYIICNWSHLFFSSAAIYLYGVAHGSGIPDPSSARVDAVDYKGSDVYITAFQHYAFSVLPILGIAIYGLINILTLPVLGLFTFLDDET